MIIIMYIKRTTYLPTNYYTHLYSIKDKKKILVALHHQQFLISKNSKCNDVINSWIYYTI